MKWMNKWIFRKENIVGRTHIENLIKFCVARTMSVVAHSRWCVCSSLQSIRGTCSFDMYAFASLSSSHSCVDIVVVGNASTEKTIGQTKHLITNRQINRDRPITSFIPHHYVVCLRPNANENAYVPVTMADARCPLSAVRGRHFACMRVVIANICVMRLFRWWQK